MPGDPSIKQLQKRIKEQEGELLRQRAENQALLDSTRAILAFDDFEKTARIIFDGCISVIGATSGYIALLNDDGTENEVVFLESGGQTCTVDVNLPMPIRGLRKEAYRKGKAVFDNNFSTSKWMKYMPEGHVRLDNVLFAPLIIDHKAAGLFGIANKQGGFTDEDARVAGSFAQLAAVALKNHDSIKQLSESRERFQSVVETIPHGVQENDLTGTITFSNHAHHKILGYPQGELIGRKIWDFMPTDKEKEGLEKYLAFLVEIQPPSKSSVVKNLTRDGRLIEVQLDWDYKRDMQGNLTGFITVVTDVTDKNRAEETLRQRTLSLGEQVRELNCLYEISDLAEQVDRSYEEIIAKALNSIPPAMGFPESVGARIVYNDYEVRTENFRETPWKMTGNIHIHGKDSGYIDVFSLADKQQDQAEPFSGKDHFLLKEISERLARVIEYKEDHASLQNALQQAKGAKAKTERILSAIGQGLSIQDTDFKIIYQNQLHKDLLGDHVGEYCYKAYESNNDICPGCPLSRCFEDGKIHSCERCITKGGDSQHYEITASPLRDRDGRITSGLEVVRNITEQKQMLQNIIRARNLESLGSLAGGIAHDFNNMLTAVFGNIELAKNRLNPQDIAYQLLTQAEKASSQAKALTKQLLTFSRGGSPLKETMPIVDFLQETTNFILSGTKIKFEYQIPDDLWPVQIDLSQMGQVIQNILQNAKEAMPPGGNLVLHAENISIKTGNKLRIAPGDYIKISFKDSGPGIDPSILPKIYDPYFSTKERGAQRGTGMGLAICHSIIEKHDGQITAESTPGKGSTFTIYLPAKPLPPYSENLDVTEKPITKQKRVLYMEDEEAVIQVAREMFNLLDYETEFALTGEEAIILYNKANKSDRPYDLVILDLTIRGGMGGEETIARLLEIDPGVKALVASGYTDNPILANPEFFGFSGAITKPFSIADLSDAVKKLLDAGGN
ncbi:MAG: PAS domain S-box protein [Proteobacteria bacterium]|nr:PAS domain S-box protein [Pseudomonadota bacterium]